MLATFYEQLKKHNDNFDIVFVSSDNYQVIIHSPITQQ